MEMTRHLAVYTINASAMNYKNYRVSGTIQINRADQYNTFNYYYYTLFFLCMWQWQRNSTAKLSAVVQRYVHSFVTLIFSIAIGYPPGAVEWKKGAASNADG